MAAEPASSFSTPGHSAPERTQSTRSATSASLSFPFGGILRSLW